MAGRRFLGGLKAPFLSLDSDYSPILNSDVANRGWVISYIQNNTPTGEIQVEVSTSYTITNETQIFVNNLTSDIILTLPNPSLYTTIKRIKLLNTNNHIVKIVSSSGTIEGELEIILWINKTAIGLLPYNNEWSLM